jgi:2,3-bisphosphoglycerate-dependent phosphoglycerate mutase
MGCLSARLTISSGVRFIYRFDTNVRPVGQCFLDLPHAAGSDIL